MSAGLTPLVTVHNVPPTATYEVLLLFCAKYASVVNVDFLGEARDGGKIALVEARTHNDALFLIRHINKRKLDTHELRAVLNYAETYKIPEIVVNEISKVIKVISPEEVVDALRHQVTSSQTPAGSTTQTH